LTEEWNSYERPAGTIAMQISIQQCELEFDEDVVRAQYWMAIKGGYRWEFSDLVLVCQFFKKKNGTWKLSYQTDSWGLDYNLSKQKPGIKTFDFDYVYPVRDLTRALAFYTPLLGKPERVSETRATFLLEGPRFHLDTSTLGGHAEIQAKLPCGYAIFYVDDLNAELERLNKTAITIVSKIETWGSDLYIICEDPSTNIFVIMQKTTDSITTKSKHPPTLTLHNDSIDSMKRATEVKTIMEAWLTMNLGALNKYIDGHSSWFDDSRSKVNGVDVGSEAITKALRKDWESYDRSTSGITADMDITSLTEKRMGKWNVFSYHRKLSGNGSHPFKETAWVTQIFEGRGTLGNVKSSKLVSSYIVRSNNTNAAVMELDYTGYPVSSLATAEKFYTNTLMLGNPYKDSAYRGYWSKNSVFGIYTTKFNRDGLPRPHKTNGYVSFWIHSAKETHSYLQRKGTSFLNIPAINSKTGIDPQPGYTQILATDSEGNGLIFTEYPGN
jgi:predicted enzyme related to lactoylglutathione lyase